MVVEDILVGSRVRTSDIHWRYCTSKRRRRSLETLCKARVGSLLNWFEVVVSPSMRGDRSSHTNIIYNVRR
jgi:hypothetical protein